MKVLKLLLQAEWRSKRKRLIAILCILFLAFFCMTLSLTLFTSGQISVMEKMAYLGYGDLTVWVSGEPDDLAGALADADGVDHISGQDLIYSDYRIGDRYSDNEGQLIPWDASAAYRFIDKSGREASAETIGKGEIYISPALRSSFDVSVGSSVFFEYSRSARPREFIVKGYFEDAFMGSSMIDMKSFLISRSDYEELQRELSETKEADATAKVGAMLHVFGEEGVSANELTKALVTGTDLSLYTEFIYTAQTIKSYTLLLQNILCAFLLAFSVLCFVTGLIVSARSISDELDEEGEDFASLKVTGMEAESLRLIFLILYGSTALAAGLCSLPPGVLAARAFAMGLVSSTGLLVGVKAPAGLLLLLIAAMTAAFVVFIFARTRPLQKLRPVSAMSMEGAAIRGKVPGIGKALVWSLALRTVLTDKKRYAGLFLIALLLTVFLSVIGRMSVWIGPNGEGLMNAFSVADHDLGIQPFNETVPMDEIERAIDWYSPVKERYELAMQSVFVDGMEYTANVLSDTSFFHVLRGNVCGGNEILITDTVAGELGVGIGDEVTVTGEGRSGQYTVSGIYMCANGMGSNIGMSLAGYSRIGNVNGYIWCHHFILENGNVRDYAADFIREHYHGIDVHTNSWSGLDGIVRLIHLAVYAVYALAALFISISVWLTSGALIRAETEEIAIYRSLGMQTKDLRLSFGLRFGIVVLAGSLAGAVLSGIFGDSAVGTIFKRIGIGSFSVHAPVITYLLPVMLIVALFFLFALRAGRRIKEMSIVLSLAENG